jgi:hypothetical protein
MADFERKCLPKISFKVIIFRCKIAQNFLLTEHCEWGSRKISELGAAAGKQELKIHLDAWFVNG